MQSEQATITPGSTGPGTSVPLLPHHKASVRAAAAAGMASFSQDRAWLGGPWGPHRLIHSGLKVPPRKLRPDAEAADQGPPWRRLAERPCRGVGGGAGQTQPQESANRARPGPSPPAPGRNVLQGPSSLSPSHLPLPGGAGQARGRVGGNGWEIREWLPQSCI